MEKDYRIVFNWGNIFKAIGGTFLVVGVFVFVVYVLAHVFNKPPEDNSTDQPVDIEATDLNVTGVMKSMQAEDIVVGNGQEVKKGDTLTVDYTGTLTDGTKFDSSKDRGQPFEFTVGNGDVIQGWDQGLIGMKVGGTRKLTIPPELAYGDQERPGIPANSTLVFEIELLGIK